MKSILLRLYDGEICPAEQFNLKTEEYRSMRQAHYQHYEDFIEQLKSLDPPLHKNLFISWTSSLTKFLLNFPGHSLKASVWAHG